MNKPFYQFLLFLAGSFVCLYLAYSATVNITYTNHDSIRYFHKFYNQVNPTNPLYGYLRADGRLAGAEVEELLYKNINHLSDLSHLRLITIVVVALCTSLLIMAAQSYGMGAIPAFCLCTAIFTLPGVQDIIFVPYLYVALAIFLSLLAYFILTSKLAYIVRFIFTLALLETAFFMYPPATFFFLIPTMFSVIFHNDWQVIKKIWGRDTILWVLAAIIFYFTLRVFFYAQVRSTYHEIAFTGKQILFNITTFLPSDVPQVFNLWNVYYSAALGIFMVIVVAAFIMIDSLVAKKMSWKRLCALAALFFIFNLVWFLFGGYMPRQSIAAQALALALVYWCGERYGIFSRIWPVLFLSTGLILAYQMTTSNVLNNNAELMFMRSRLAQFVDSTTKEIHIIGQKDNTKGYNGLPIVYDNINSPTDDYEFPDLIRVALKDLPDPFILHCNVTYSRYGELFNVLPHAVVIDMNDLVYISSKSAGN